MFYEKFYGKITGEIYDLKSRNYDRFATLFTREVERRPPRVLDIDIIYYDFYIIMDTKKLKIPHERIQYRIFYLKPILDIE